MSVAVAKVVLPGALALLLLAPRAQAETVEASLLFATDGAAIHLFPANPAAHKPTALQGGVALAETSRETTLEQDESAGDDIKNKSSVSHVAFGTLVDLGAGAGLGITHQNRYEKLVSTFSSRPGQEIEELTRQQQTTAKLLIELTDEIKGAMAIRYLYKEWAIYGSPSLDKSQRTTYNASMVGYGSGFMYHNKVTGLGYAYFPPLRGKSKIQGEEKIVVEPGEILVDGHYSVNKELRLGVMYKRWLHELDDRKSGTTADDDETRISLYGLDVDQYVFPMNFVGLGADYQVNGEVALRAMAGREEAEFNFRELMRLSRLDVDQDRDHHEYVRSNKLKVMLTYSNRQVGVAGGIGIHNREKDLPSRMNGGHYEASIRETFLTLDMKL